jgi:hypothetical protein
MAATDDKKPISMGCRVGDPHRDEKKPAGALGASYRKDAQGNVTFHSVSWVSAPTCSICRTSLVPASSVSWKCPNKECPKVEETLDLGVYPAFTSSER